VLVHSLIRYEAGPQGLMVTLYLPTPFLNFAGESPVIQAILNPLSQLFLGRSETEAYLEELNYSQNQHGISDLIAWDISDARRRGLDGYLKGIVSLANESSRPSYSGPTMFDPRPGVRQSAEFMDDLRLRKLFMSAAEQAGEAWRDLVKERQSRSPAQVLAESKRDGYGPRMTETVIVGSGRFTSGILRKLRGQEEQRMAQGIDDAERLDIKGFQGERVASYMAGADIVPFRDDFFVTFMVEIPNLLHEDGVRFVKDHTSFVNQAVAFARAIAEVNPSISFVTFAVENGQWQVTFSGPKVQYFSQLRGGSSRETPQAPIDPDLLGSFTITESDFHDHTKREAFFERIIRPPEPVAPLHMDYRKIMTRTDIDQRINQIPRSARPGIGFLDPAKDGELRFQFGDSQASFTHTTAFSAHAGSLYVADLSTQRGMKPVFYRIYPKESQWFKEVPQSELPDQIEKDFGVGDPTNGRLTVKPIADIRDWVAGLLVRIGLPEIARITRIVFGWIAAAVEIVPSLIPSLFPWMHREEDREFVKFWQPVLMFSTVTGGIIGLLFAGSLPVADQVRIFAASGALTNFFLHGIINTHKELVENRQFVTSA
jgi:hypothetical protein